MDSNVIKLAAVFAAAFLLAACTTPPPASTEPMTILKKPAKNSGIVTTELMVVGKPASGPNNPAVAVTSNVSFSNKKLLKVALDGYANIVSLPPQPPLKDLIDAIENANENQPATPVPGLTGLGGILGHAFLDKARENLTGNTFDRKKRVVTSVSGQITDYEFTEDPANPGKGTGRIEATTYVTSRVVSQGLGSPPARITDIYKYKVKVENNGFSVVTKGSIANDPFPGTMNFSKEMRDRIDSLGFQYKLWAEGTDIVVEEVEITKHGGSPKTYTKATAPKKYARLFKADANACIDMLFVDPPPADLNGMGPPFYCLGRCANPLIINTGI